MPYWNEPKHNDPDEIDGPDDVTLPSTMHHMQAKAELDLLVREGVIDDGEAHEVMTDWRARQKIGDERRLRAAVRELEDRDLIGPDQADTIVENMVG